MSKRPAYPHVLEYITELREERERKYGVTLIGQLERLHKLSLGAEEEGQFSAAINAEKIRSSLGGLTVDRRENQHIHQYDKMSRDEIIGRLSELRDKYPTAFVDVDYEEVNADTGTEPVAQIEEKPATSSTLHSD